MLQEYFDKTVSHLRSQGNPWGSSEIRGWNFVNPENPCQRCAKGVHCEVEYDEGIGYHLTDSALNSLPMRRDGTVLGQLAARLEVIFERHKVSDWEDLFKETAKEFGLIYRTKSSVSAGSISNTSHVEGVPHE